MGKPERIEGKKKFYSKVLINKEEVTVNDTVTVCPEAEDEPVYVARIAYMWEDAGGKKLFHAHWFSRGSETVLGETGDPCELFLVDLCDDSPLGAIMDKIKVHNREYR